MLRYERDKLKGFVLLTVLLFMQILALLALHVLEQALLANKMSQAHYQHYLLFSEAEAVLKIAEAHAPACEIAITNSQQLIKFPLVFWRSLSCSGIFSNFQYYYVTESLGEDPCADLSYQNMTANYFRVTLLAILNNNAKILLQSVIVKPTIVTKICHGNHHLVIAGRQTWRILE